MEFKLLLAGIALFILSRVMAYFKPKIQKPGLQKIYKEICEWVETGWSAVILAAFLMYFFIQAFKIPSGSMRMTLLEGDHLFVNKFIYGFHIPLSNGKRIWSIRHVQRGDIIVFECPLSALSLTEREEKIKKDFIKRCIALGGDLVEIKDKKLFVNGKLVAGTYTSFVDDMVYPPAKIFPTSEQYQRTWEAGKFTSLPSNIIKDNFGPVIVPPGHYFVLGDNRDCSFDSRFWGPLPEKYLKGRALFLYWPPNRMRLIK